MKRLASQEAKLARLESMLSQEGGKQDAEPAAAQQQEESDSLSRSARALNQLTKR